MIATILIFILIGILWPDFVKALIGLGLLLIALFSLLSLLPPL
jgi:hypothetical protein